jgi:phospholipid/cholesterol/gamma-HCH transport system ATP-binding protein
MKGDKTPIIQVQDVTAGYPERVVLEHISFEIYRGEVFVILGGSGSGKSTLLKHMIGLVPPLEGRILIEGEDIAAADEDTRRRIQQRIGVLFQSGALFGSLTLADNVALLLEEYTHLPHEIIDLFVRMKLSMVNLSGFESYMPAALSGGMKKRAGLARAMALDPQILFFDELSAGLDPLTSAALDELVLQLNKSLRATMIVVTHELPSIFAIADRVIMLDSQSRTIVAEGVPQDLRDHSPNQRVRDFFNRKPETVAERRSHSGHRSA